MSLKAEKFEPEEGWYKDTGEDIEKVIVKLRNNGVEDKVIEEVINTMIIAISNEYGN